MHIITELWKTSPNFEKTLGCIKGGQKLIKITNINNACLNAFLFSLSEELSNTPILFISSSSYLHKFVNQFKRLEKEIKIFPNTKLSLLDGLGESNIYFAQISNILSSWVNNINNLVVCDIHSLSQPLMNKTDFVKQQLVLKKNQSINLSHTLNALIKMNYERVDSVLELGQFAVRGDIIDIFPPESIDELPFRINLFDDIIETIKTFEPWTQRSLSSSLISQISISPLRPYNDLSENKKSELFSFIQELEEVQGTFWQEALKQGEWQLFIPWSQELETFHTPLHYFPENGLIILEEPLSFEGSLNNLIDYQKAELEKKLSRKHLPLSQKEVFDYIINLYSQIKKLIYERQCLVLESSIKSGC